MSRGWVRWNGRLTPRTMVAVVSPEVTGINAGEHVGGEELRAMHGEVETVAKTSGARPY